MKKSRIFLGVSSVVLAVAGIAATKANTKFTNYYYHTTGTAATCLTAPTPTGCSGTTGKCTESITVGQVTGTYTIFTVNTSSVCSHQLGKP